MDLKKTIITRLILTFAVPLMATAQDNTTTIADVINDSSSIVIVQPPKLNDRLLPSTNEEGVPEVTEPENEPRQQAGKTAGYRVQIFSDNNPRTSKNEARTKEKAIMADFPQYATYVTYNSPYWRLKVGDFTTMDEAEAVADELKRHFPSYAREIRVVRDRINVFK